MQLISRVSIAAVSIPIDLHKAYPTFMSNYNGNVSSKMTTRTIKIIISGGGTGGHIFPAIAIADALRNSGKEVEILFVGALGRMEMEKVPAAGYNIEGLWISGLQRKLTIDNLSFPFKLISSINKSKQILKKFNPDIVIGVGGYASGPLLYAAAKKGIPTLIQEQNSFPGITNKILANKVNKICVAFQGMEKYFPKEKLVLTGNPVRKEMVDIKDKRDKAFAYFELDKNKKTLLVIGGSLGALTINKSILIGLNTLVNNSIQVIWQTGKSFYKEAIETTNASSIHWVKIFDFINKMDLAYAAADLVISRAGAIAVSELALVAKPTILVPSPNVTEDHQTKNAMALVNLEAAVLVKDMEAKDNLIAKAIELFNDKEKQDTLITNIRKLALNNAAEKITSEIFTLLKK